MVEVNIFISFFSGLVIGASPCILLMLSAFGTSLVLTEEKRKFLSISIGLISGMVLAFVLISIILIYVAIMLEVMIIINYIFAGVLISIGIWQIVESTKERSIIFSTPEKVKTVLSNFIQKNSGFYAFLVGIIFVLIKFPCTDLIYVSLILNFHTNPLLYVFLFIYILGMLIPIILILVLLRLGLESSRINEFRLKYRTFFRILSGAILIFLAIFLLVYQLILY